MSLFKKRKRNQEKKKLAEDQQSEVSDNYEIKNGSSKNIIIQSSFLSFTNLFSIQSANSDKMNVPTKKIQKISEDDDDIMQELGIGKIKPKAVKSKHKLKQLDFNEEEENTSNSAINFKALKKK